ncbi:MAG: HK97-gp10 family putative phage morphogenesis protein [Alphaproteobacteria bacterium]
MITAKIKGLAELRSQLTSLGPKLRRRAVRNALAAGAREVRDEIKRNTPMLDLSNASSRKALRRGVRKPGTLKAAVKVRTSKYARRAGDVGVFVNVKPLRGGGARNPNDPFYWRFVQFGWTPRGSGHKVPGRPFIETGQARLNNALQIFSTRIAAEVVRLNVRRSVE